MASTLWIPASYLIQIVACLVILVLDARSQDVLDESGCNFHDGQQTFNIQLRKTYAEYPCKSTESLDEKIKARDSQTLDLYTKLSDLQMQMNRLLEHNLNLTKTVSSVQHELDVTREALRMHQVAASSCPPGYEGHNDQFKSCYMYVARSLSWYDSEAFCMSTGGHLLGLETEAESTYIINYIRSSLLLPGVHIWTGGNDIAKEDHWMWAGINQEFTNFTNWLLYMHHDDGPIQMPDNHQNQEHCVQLFHLHEYEWNDIYCGYLYYFICEYKLI